MRAVAIDNGDFKIAVERRARYGKPLRYGCSAAGGEKALDSLAQHVALGQAKPLLLQIKKIGLQSRLADLSRSAAGFRCLPKAILDVITQLLEHGRKLRKALQVGRL